MNTKEIAKSALFVALTAACAQIVVPLPFSPVPLSLSLVPVLLSGALLEKKQAALSMLAYILLGAAGAPVFSGFGAGLGKLLGPTGGYIAAYPIMAFIIALICQSRGARFLPLLLGMTLAVLVCYGLGSAWLAFSAKMDIKSALMAGALPFIPLDLAKIALCASLSAAINRALNQK